MKYLKLTQFIIYVFLALYNISCFAVVLDWTGSFKLEVNGLYKPTNFTVKDSQIIFYDLILKPDIKVFDGVFVKSWFQLSPQNQIKNPKFSYLTTGGYVSNNNTKMFLPSVLEIRELYLESSHEFGFFQIGLSQLYHFGLGMHYNNLDLLFIPVAGRSGFISWKGFIGSSYYVQTRVDYIQNLLFNIFIQAGLKADNYGLELMYKTFPLGSGELKKEDAFSYIGAYAFYQKDKLSIKAEGGKTSHAVYGGVIDIDWATPIKYLAVGLDLGLSTVEQKSAFYFDPSFSHQNSVFIAQYKSTKLEDSLSKQYVGYSFNSTISVAPSISILFSDSLSLEFLSSVYFEYPKIDISLYSTDLIFKYNLQNNLIFQIGTGILFPKQDTVYLGIQSKILTQF